jgi:hypothetical protein
MNSNPSGALRVRMASGTAWIPDSSRVRGSMLRRGAWMLSVHGSATLQYDRQDTQRGDTQLALVDWAMIMASRTARGGLLQVRAMTSLEPWLLGGDGYPLLLQTGGTYRHGVLHDRQHPHDALMELATSYAHDVGAGSAVSLYAAAVGEPAIGPVASMHRPSAANDPMMPLGHHWQDASHQSFGVVTLGLATRSLQLEGSVFNPREPDEHHLVVDYRGAALDSYAGRLTWSATPHVVASTWWGFLNSHDRLDPSTRMHRYGASVLTDARGLRGGRWSTTLVWAMNVHHHGGASHELIHGGPGASPHHHASSMLAESNLEIGSATSVFARAERVMKSGEELGFLGGDLTALYDVRSYVLGISQRVAAAGAAELAIGARGSVNFIPQSLFATYRSRTPRGFAVYAQLRPRHIM